MKLTVLTPLAISVRAEDVMHVRGEDARGAFGILRGHADFLTVLEISILIWRDAADVEHYVAVRGGTFAVKGGEDIVVAAPEAVAGDSLQALQTDVLARFRRQLEEERTARMDAHRLHVAAIRRIIELLRPETRAAAPVGGAPYPAMSVTDG